MNEEHQKEEEQRYAGLTTAALVDASERTALKKDFGLGPPEIELQRKVRAADASILGENNVATAGTAAAVATDEPATPLFSPDEAKEFRVRWGAIQGSFVDEPATRWSRRIVSSRRR